MQRDDAYLLDMLLAARDAVEFAAELTFPQFKSSRLHQNAILKSMETIGEAASRLNSGPKDAHPEIAWHAVIGMRNRLVHEYFHINLDIIWQTIQEDLPLLIARLEPLIPPEDS